MKNCKNCKHLFARDICWFCDIEGMPIEHPSSMGFECECWEEENELKSRIVYPVNKATNYFNELEHTNLTLEQQEAYSKLIDEMCSRFKNKEITEWQFRCNAMDLIYEILAKEYAQSLVEVKPLRVTLTPDMLDKMEDFYATYAEIKPSPEWRDKDGNIIEERYDRTIKKS